MATKIFGDIIMKHKNLLTIGITVIFVTLFTGCPQPIEDDVKIVPEKLRGIWVNNSVMIAFTAASLSFGAGDLHSPVYTVTQVNDSSIFVKDADGAVILFANYTMPNSTTLGLSGGQTSGTAFAGTYIKSMD
ncbi:MAG: hypothetical protein LBI91_01650 [Spirochaetaceae bacterium]|nr:hypothetical protein [Spirochaetaceae bacterium]